MVASRVLDARRSRPVRQRAYCRSLRDALQAIPGAAPAQTASGWPGRLASAMEVDELSRGVLARERRAVARAISAVEDGAPELEALSAGLYATDRARPPRSA